MRSSSRLIISLKLFLANNASASSDLLGGERGEALLAEAKQQWSEQNELASATSREEEERRPVREARKHAKRARLKREPRLSKAQPKRAKRPPSPKRPEKDVSVEEDPEDKEGEEESVVSLLHDALVTAETGLELQYVSGAFIEMDLLDQYGENGVPPERLTAAREELGDFSDELLDELLLGTTENDQVGRLGRYLRVQRLMKLNVPMLRNLAETSVGKKRELVIRLAKQYSAASLGPFQIVPSEETCRLLEKDARNTLCSLQYAAIKSSETARLTALARDAHVAWIWRELGQTNCEVVDTLNLWFGTSHSHTWWRNRKRRGLVLLQYPVLAYQTVLSLVEVSARDIMAAMHLTISYANETNS